MPHPLQHLEPYRFDKHLALFVLNSLGFTKCRSMLGALSWQSLILRNGTILLYEPAACGLRPGPVGWCAGVPLTRGSRQLCLHIKSGISNVKLTRRSVFLDAHATCNIREKERLWRKQKPCSRKTLHLETPTNSLFSLKKDN